MASSISVGVPGTGKKGCEVSNIGKLSLNRGGGVGIKPVEGERNRQGSIGQR